MGNKSWPGNRYTDRQRRQWAKYYLADVSHSTAKTAEHFGVTDNAVRHGLARLGVQRRAAGFPSSQLPVRNGRKRCRNCKKPRPLARFRLVTGKTGKRYRANICRTCVTEREKDRKRDENLQKKYNITHDQFLLLLKRQHGACKICGYKPDHKHLCVDHDHRTGKVRALLCDRCNQGLGYFSEDARLLRRAARYVDLYSQRSLIPSVQ